MRILSRNAFLYSAARRPMPRAAKSSAFMLTSRTTFPLFKRRFGHGVTLGAWLMGLTSVNNGLTMRFLSCLLCCMNKAMLPNGTGISNAAHCLRALRVNTSNLPRAMDVGPWLKNAVSHRRPSKVTTKRISAQPCRQAIQSSALLGHCPISPPQPNVDGSCATYTIKAGDLCDTIASSHHMTVDIINQVNKNTWGWTGCSLLMVGQTICISTGLRPFPPPISNAVCGSQVNKLLVHSSVVVVFAHSV